MKFEDDDVKTKQIKSDRKKPSEKNAERNKKKLTKEMILWILKRDMRGCNKYGFKAIELQSILLEM